MFMAAMWEQYPKLVDGVWRKGQTNWSRCAEDKGGICYLPRIVHDKSEVPYCQSTSIDSHIGEGYAIIEFSDLLVRFDLGEIPSPVFDIKSLFDIE